MLVFPQKLLQPESLVGHDACADAGWITNKSNEQAISRTAVRDAMGAICVCPALKDGVTDKVSVVAGQ